ncbi:alpha/beta fold hydrolase [Noviluteimonas gilva]|uniref:Alpha/beta fold hydrolase n=1 Tax=Noviluteimonas gilva TaxID=2682097 RepID=A0A7C9LIZ3_9GAMM|nr:alpha/beta hydrolase [Lysobacter gilvus]MUV14319.1 alpha/beta fold hydrolase [Lysobacter gilvus]
MQEMFARNDVAGVDIAYVAEGHPRHPAIVLVMGMAAQLIHWPRPFVDALLAHDFYVVRMDNRDAGRSTHLHSLPAPDFAAIAGGNPASAPYSLVDMASDVIAVLDALGVARAHVAGASLGGAIAQTAAIAYPERVASLTSIMSTTGDTAVGQAHPSTLAAVFSGKPISTKEAYVDRMVRAYEISGAGTFAKDASEIRRVANLAYDRGHDDAAMARQAAAAMAAGDRTTQLRQLGIPTQVVHGLADTVCDPSGGIATATAIPGSCLTLVEGMGHSLPDILCSHFADLVARVAHRAMRPSEWKPQDAPRLVERLCVDR